MSCFVLVLLATLISLSQEAELRRLLLASTTETTLAAIIWTRRIGVSTSDFAGDGIRVQSLGYGNAPADERERVGDSFLSPTKSRAFAKLRFARRLVFFFTRGQFVPRLTVLSCQTRKRPSTYGAIFWKGN